MRRVLNIEAWLDKLMVSIVRRRGRSRRHLRLTDQLATNRGKALGLPYKFPNTRYQQRLAEARNRRWWMKNPTPF